MPRLNDFLTHINLDPLICYCREHGDEVAYAKGERLAQEGEICRDMGIVLKGYFKYTSLNSKGEECVTGFSFKDEVVTDYVRSFLFNQPSLTSIIAGSDAVVLQVRIADIRKYLLSHNPDFLAKSATILLHEAYSRYLSLHILTPAERYAELCHRYHDVISDIPYQEIASYLAISRRQFQRIRSN